MGFGVSCIQHPETGRELEYGTRDRVSAPRRIAVVGGGPGGMKTASVAAERGHKVTLFERQARLGGQALLAQSLPGRAEFGGVITNLESELDRFNVEIRLKTEVTRERLLNESYGAIVIASGATPRIPVGEFEGAHVVTSWDVIEGQANVGKNVVIADWACDWIGLGVAEKLALDGCSVKLCVNGEMAGQALQSFVRTTWAGRLQRLGVELIPLVRLFGADADTAYLQHAMNGDPILCEGMDTLVLAYGHVAADSLYTSLLDEGLEIHAVGDCLSPRTAEEAVLEGLKVGSIL